MENRMEYDTFQKAYKGYEKIPDKREGLLTIIDFTKPSNEKRFFVIDLNKKKIDYSTYVTHGKNSGLTLPLNFSNNRNSYMSSLGFYITGDAYEGKYGYSLRLQGLEEGFNSNAYRRAIVVHGADYADPSFIEKYGFLGRSEGCPAIPTTISKDVIDYIKGKTVLFIMGKDKHYIEKSRYASL
nr:murein L,D-transpeptidase catalytic domain family protein [uncultured Fusobacterium sp.]